MGVLLPKEIVEQNKLENGEVIQMAVLKKNLTLLNIRRHAHLNHLIWPIHLSTSICAFFNLID